MFQVFELQVGLYPSPYDPNSIHRFWGQVSCGDCTGSSCPNVRQPTFVEEDARQLPRFLAEEQHHAL